MFTSNNKSNLRKAEQCASTLFVYIYKLIYHYWYALQIKCQIAKTDVYIKIVCILDPDLKHRLS